jgi:hypothetical protein
LNKNSNTDLSFEFDLNSREIWEFELIRSSIMMFRVQIKGFKFKDVTALPTYKNLIPRFRGEENPRLRIGTKYLNRREEDQDSRGKGISVSASSLSFGKWAPKVYMTLCSQGREGNIFWWWKLQSRDELECTASNVMHTIGQKKSRWVHEN